VTASGQSVVVVVFIEAPGITARAGDGGNRQRYDGKRNAGPGVRYGNRGLEASKTGPPFSPAGPWATHQSGGAVRVPAPR